MKNIDNLPIYSVRVNPDAEDEGMWSISLVDRPAVELPYLMFSDDEKPRFNFADDEKHIISGIAILADTPIYRYNEEEGEYYITFPKDVIRTIVEKYFREGRVNITNLQHLPNYTDTDLTMIESFFIDKSRGICPKEFENVPDGSLYVSYHVNNDDLWNEIKTSGELNGFSIEITANLERVLFRTAEKTEKTEKSENGEQSFDEFVDDLLFSADLADVMDWCVRKRPVMLRYDDDTNTAATGYRQGAIVAVGLSTAGNEVFRFAEWYGDSSTIPQDWKLMRLDRVISIRELTEAYDWQDIDLWAGYNPVGDRSMSAVYAHA